MSQIDDFLEGRASQPTQKNQIDAFLDAAPPPTRGFKGWAQDIAGTAINSAIGVPEAIVGLADIPTGGAVGKFLENEGGSVGFRPKQAKEFVNESIKSDASREARRKFSEADGIVDKTVAAVQNPSLILEGVGESLGAMGAGGVASRGLMAATKLGQMGATGAALAGAAGEGITMAGSAAEQIRQETPDGLLTPTQAGLAAATGVAGAAIGAVGGRVAQKLGIGDAETLLAQGTKGMAKANADDAARAAVNPLVQQQAVKSIPRRVIEGAISEGFLEELPQSVAEQVFQNVALGKDWLQDVDAAVVMGVLSGSAMGGAAAGYHGIRQPKAGELSAAPGNVPPAGGEQPGADARNPGLDRIQQSFADQLAALQQQEQGEPAVPQTTPPDGATVLVQQQAAEAARRQAAIDASRAVASPDDEIYQSTGAAVPRSVAMGLDPAAGPLSASAALAVDSGASDQMQQAAALAQAAEVAQKQGKKPAQSNQKQEQKTAAQQGVNPETGEILQDTPIDSWTDAQLSEVFRGAQSRDVRMQLAKELGRRRDLREQQELQAELDAEQRASVPGAERADAAFASLTEDAGEVPADLTNPATTEGNRNGPQAAQAQQDRAQPPQVGAAPAVASAAPAAQGRGSAQGAGAAGVAGGTETANAGAQAAPAAGAQAAAQAEDPAQRVAAAGDAWTRMPTAERQALAQRADLKPIVRKNVHRAAWADLNRDVQRKLAQAMEPVQETRPDQPVQAAADYEAQVVEMLDPASPRTSVTIAAGDEIPESVLRAQTNRRTDPGFTMKPAKGGAVVLTSSSKPPAGEAATTAPASDAEPSPLVKAMNDLAEVRARIEQQGQVVDDRLLQRERQLKAMVKELEADGQNDELDAEMQSYEDKATVSLRGKAAGDMLEMGNGTLYRIAGIDTAANRIRLARNPDQLNERTVLVDQDGYNKLLADHEQTMAEAAATPVAPTPAKAQETPPEASGKKKPSADQTRAKADLMAALADLGDILGKNTRMNIMPEQEQKLLPVLTRVLDAAFRLGYAKFKDSAKFALDQIRANLGDDAADALTLDHLQGAYIAMAGGKQGVDSKRAVIDVESKAEIEAHEASVAAEEDEADNAEQEKPSDERTTVRSESPQALDAVAAEEGGRVEGERGAGAGAADSGQAGAAGSADADAAGIPPARSGGSGVEPVRAPKTRARGRAGAVGAQGTGATGEPVPQADGRVAVPEGEASAPNIPAADFQITDEVGLGKGGEVQKFTDNLAAIRTLKAIEAANRRATPEEQAALARYVGWGGLANAFPDPGTGQFKDKWRARGEELREQLNQTFPKATELVAKRERLRELVGMLEGKSQSAVQTTPEEAEAGDESPGEPAAFRREDEGRTTPFDVNAFLKARGRPSGYSEAAQRQAIDSVTATVDAIRAAWGLNAPEVVVAFDMQDERIPEAARKADLRQRSGGARGAPEGFYYRGKAYLMASRLPTPNDAVRVLYHEVLGHHGLRGKFGRELDQVLNQIATMRKAEVAAKMQDYGLRGVNSLSVREAAEEVLAEMAEKNPRLPFVQRAISAIRNFLRMHVPGFQSLRLTDSDIVQAYILPARGWVVRGGPGGGPRGGLPVMSRSGGGGQAEALDSATDIRFSRSSTDELKDGALAQIHQALTHPGKVSLWDKTVGTMRNLAERSPVFKPVYEAAQRFIDDVSMLGNDAADRAPRLLPRVETLADLKKKPITAADNQAVAKPLFEGTLLWARDVDGTPVTTEALNAKYRNATPDEKAQILLRTGKIQEQMLKVWRGLPVDQYNTIINNKFDSTILKPGVVWTAKELQDLFGLNAQQVSLYQEARAAIDRSIDMTARADMLRALGADYADLREAVLAQANAEDAMVLITDALQAEAREAPDQADRILSLNNAVVKSYERAQALMDAGYAPLSRFGRYTVDVVSPDGTREYFGMFESVYESNKMKAAMEKEFPGATVTQGTMSDEAFKLFQGITPESLEQFGNMLGLSGDGDDAKDKAFQAYLQLAKNNHSALKRLIHRKGISGYSEDVGRVLASFVYSNARLAAGGLNAGTLEKAIEGIPKEQGELRDVAMGLRSYIQDPQEEGQAVRGMLFAQYLGGSVASAVVNMTQPFQITMPWLSQFGGIRKASGQMVRALNDMRRSFMDKGFKYEPDLAKALHTAEAEGIVSPQEIHQLMAQARGAGSLRTGDGTKMGDARATAANNWERVKVAWGQPFALAEQFNRRSTFIAAYRMAKEQGMADPAKFAERAVLETQFVYSKANKPKWARGTIGGTLFTFKTYSVSYLELMHRMWTQGGPEGKRAVGWAVAMLLLMGGAGGLPFMEDAEDLIDGAGQLMGYNVSTKQWRKQLMRDTIGKELADFVENGVSGLPGAPIDVSGRLGMGNLIPGTGLLLSKQSRERDLLEVAGPAGDLVARGFTGARKVLTGDLAGAALEVSPTAVRNAFKGADMATSGIYKDTKGYKVIDTTLDEAISKAIGFQPKSVAEVQEANSFMQRSKSFYIQTSSDIKAQWAQAVFEKDDAALQRVRDRLAAWNRNNPDQPIVVKIPDVMKRVREMGKDRTERIADTAPKALRDQMRSLAREATQGPA